MIIESIGFIPIAITYVPAISIDRNGGIWLHHNATANGCLIYGDKLLCATRNEANALAKTWSDYNA